MPERHFSMIVNDLRQTAARLTEATDPNHRHELLQRMRLLLWEADLRMLDSESSATQS